MKKLNHKLKSIRIYEIAYDTDGEEIDLPSELTMEVNSDDVEEIADLASDYISDTTGFCHDGFKWTYA